MSASRCRLNLQIFSFLNFLQVLFVVIGFFHWTVSNVIFLLRDSENDLYVHIIVTTKRSISMLVLWISEKLLIRSCWTPEKVTTN